MKLLVLLLELLLLFVSFVPGGDAFPSFATTVLLAILSMSLSSILALFDDEVFVQNLSWPTVPRAMSALALLLGFVLLLISVLLLSIVNSVDILAEWWPLLAVLIGLMCVPRVIVYAFMFAEDVRGLALPSTATTRGNDILDKVTGEFEER